MTRPTIKLLVGCADAKGVVAAVAGFIAEHDGNIIESDQHTDLDHGEFTMRLEFEGRGFGLDPLTFKDAWEPVARRFSLQWRVDWGDAPKRMAILVSRQTHCLLDLLWRWRAGELRVELPLVISNHAEAAELVASYGVPFHLCPVSSGTNARDQKAVLRLLDEARVDFIVLARYMQILIPEFVAAYPSRIINIHHSFLPAFAGAKPYHRAYERGVKIIGATSHYVTDRLDEGPIIEQDVTRVTHRDTVDDMIRKGRDLERMVLANAVRSHAEDKVFVNKNKTVVFN